MRGVIMHAPGDVRVEDRDDPRIIEPTDAIIRVTATCICGSDLWPYRGIEQVDQQPMGHEYVGVVEEVGGEVKTVKPGDFVVGLVRRLRQHLRDLPRRLPVPCVHRASSSGTSAPSPSAPASPGPTAPWSPPPAPRTRPDPSLLAASDVLGTGWFAAVAAEAGPGKTVAVVGDGAVGLLACWPPSNSAPSGSSPCPATRRARSWPASSAPPTSSTERGDEGVAKIKELTGGLGAHSVVEAVGTQESMRQAIAPPARAATSASWASTTTSALGGLELFFADVHLLGGPAPVRRFLPELIQLIWDRADRPRQGLRPHAAARARPPRATRRWTSDAPSRCS